MQALPHLRIHLWVGLETVKKCRMVSSKCHGFSYLASFDVALIPLNVVLLVSPLSIKINSYLSHFITPDTYSIPYFHHIQLQTQSLPNFFLEFASIINASKVFSLPKLNTVFLSLSVFKNSKTISHIVPCQAYYPTTLPDL